MVIAARTKEQLEDVANQVADRGRRALGVPCDVSDLANLDLIVDQAMSEFGRIDVVVNNAGGAMPAPFIDTSEKALEGAFHFNVTTAFTLTKLAVPHMLARDGGSIVNISSAMGRMTDRGYVAYGTAKGALSHMTRLMASDLAPADSGQRDRGRLRGDVGARDRAHQRRPAERDGRQDAAAAAWARPTTSPSPPSTWRRPPAVSSPARSSRSTAVSSTPTSP